VRRPSSGRLRHVVHRAALLNTRAKRCCCVKRRDTETSWLKRLGWGSLKFLFATWLIFFLLVTIAGAGDELQGIKRGVMELVDAVAVNKADGDNIRAAERARTEAENALHFLPASPSG